MKLIYRIVLHLCWMLSLLLGAWAVLFYISIISEVNDEMDDMLENYSEQLIIQVLTDGNLTDSSLQSRNGYTLHDVTEEYAASQPQMVYSDEVVRIPGTGDKESARVLRTIFRDAKGDFRELTVMSPTIEKEDLREAILYWMICLYGSLLVAILVVNLLVLRRTFRPLYALLRWLDVYTLGKSREPLSCDTDIVEFQSLNQAVQRAATRNEYLFERQKQFVGNASHEMQTPLAVCRNRLEMLAGDGTRLTEGQLSEIAQVQRTLDSLVRLNKSLLLLSKIDSGQFSENQQVDLSPIVRDLTGDLSEIYAARGIGLSIDEQGPLTVSMNPALAESLLGNLVKNAFVHNTPGGDVLLTLAPGMLSVSNSGESGPLDAEHLFERFYQGAKKEGSTGLGLSIVDAICRCYGFRISYTYINSRHCFRVQFVDNV